MEASGISNERKTIQTVQQIDKILKNFEESKNSFNNQYFILKPCDVTNITTMFNFINKISNSAIVENIIKIDFSGCKKLILIYKHVIELINKCRLLAKLDLSNCCKPPRYTLDILKKIFNIESITDLNLAENYNSNEIQQIKEAECFISFLIQSRPSLITFDLLNDNQEQVNVFPKIYDALERKNQNTSQGLTLSLDCINVTIGSNAFNDQFQTQSSMNISKLEKESIFVIKEQSKYPTYSIRLGSEFSIKSFEYFKNFVSKHSFRLNKLDFSQLNCKIMKRFMKFMNTKDIYLRKVKEINFGSREFHQKEFILCLKMIIIQFSNNKELMNSCCTFYSRSQNGKILPLKNPRNIQMDSNEISNNDISADNIQNQNAEFQRNSESPKIVINLRNWNRSLPYPSDCQKMIYLVTKYTHDIVDFQFYHSIKKKVTEHNQNESQSQDDERNQSIDQNRAQQRSICENTMI